MTEYLSNARSVLVQGQRTADRRRAQEDQQAQIVEVYGDTTISGPGQATYQINFPVVYVEKPTFRYGLESALASALVSGNNYLSGGVSVDRWVFKKIGLGTYWVGAILVVDVQGMTGVGVVVHHSFAGKSLRSPGFNADSIGSV